jgi:hypothetical protein
MERGSDDVPIIVRLRRPERQTSGIIPVVLIERL